MGRLIKLMETNQNYRPPRKEWTKIIPVDKLHHMYSYYMLGLLTTTPATSDSTVISVLTELFKKTKNELTPNYMVVFEESELNIYIKPLGRYQQNRDALKGQAQQILDLHNGHVPRNYDDLIELDGVGPKIANILLYEAFGINHVSLLF
jgi:endonuclease-3